MRHDRMHKIVDDAYNMRQKLPDASQMGSEYRGSMRLDGLDFRKNA